MIDYWHDMSIVVGHVQVAGHGKNCVLKTDVAEIDTTALDVVDGWMTYIGGLKTGQVDLSFMSDFAEGSMDDVFWSLLGTTTVKSVCTTSTDGGLAYLFKGIPLSYTPVEGDVGALAMGKISGKTSGSPVVRGLTLHPETLEDASGTGTPRQIGAVVTGKKLYSALHILAVDGTTPSMTVKIQSDNDEAFPSATDRITFTAATTVGEQWGTVAGAVTDDWWRAQYTLSGTNPEFLFIVTAGIV
jgi:hypothetical protein